MFYGGALGAHVIFLVIPILYEDAPNYMRNELQRGGSAVFSLQPFGHPTAGATLPLGERETIPRIAQP